MVVLCETTILENLLLLLKKIGFVLILRIDNGQFFKGCQSNYSLWCYQKKDLS